MKCRPKTGYGSNFDMGKLNRPICGLESGSFIQFLKPIVMVNGSDNLNADHTISALLEFKGIGAAVTWYKNVLGAEENMRLENASEAVTYAELGIGDSMIFLKEDDSQIPQLKSKRSKKLHVYIDDVDKAIRKAVQNNAMLLMHAEDQFYGESCACIEDPFGYIWVLESHYKHYEKKRTAV